MYPVLQALEAAVPPPTAWREAALGHIIVGDSQFPAAEPPGLQATFRRSTSTPGLLPHVAHGGPAAIPVLQAGAAAGSSPQPQMALMQARWRRSPTH